MEFDKSKVYTAFNYNEIKIGSKGYFADSKKDLITRVKFETKAYYHKLDKINSHTSDYAFTTNDCAYCYFYLVEEPKEPTKRPCTREELVEMLKKQGLPMLKNTDGKYYTISKISSAKVLFCDESFFDFDYEHLCIMFTLLDGTELWVEE